MAASKKKKSGLGKGLNELFQGEDIQTMIDAIEKKPSQFAQIQVPIDQIRPNPYQPRKHFDEEKLNELLHFLSAKKYSEMPGKQNRVLDYGALKINAEYRSVESNGELVQLTNYEFEILYLLAKNPGRIFSKEQIYTQVWKEPYYGAEDNVMGIIRRIRKKIEPDSAKPRYILNVWGMGYKFNGELMK